MNYNNLAQKSNFTAGSDKLDLTQLFLTSVNLPGITFSHPEIGGRSGTKLNLASDSMSFNSLSLTLLIDEDFLIYKEFNAKAFDNVNPETGSYAQIEFDFWVDVTNSKGNHLFKMEFTNCRVESIGDIEFDTQSDETEFTVSVEIKFDFHKMIMPETLAIPTLNV